MTKKKARSITVGGDVFTAQVLRVVESDELGRPLLLRVCRTDERILLSEETEANRFLVVFAKEGSV
jgi:hypothetical protein